MTAASNGPIDYYAVLQVRSDAERAVIDAAYRGLMKKYHPDVAGDDPQRIQEHLAIARLLNEAYSVLRDPVKRKQYDAERLARGWVQPSVDYTPGAQPPTAGPQASGAPSGQTGQGGPPNPPGSPPAGASATPPPEGKSPGPGPRGSVIVPAPQSGLHGPLAIFGAAYYLLPGPYEWEEGSRRELLTVALLPVAGLAAFALLTGRLDTWIGHSLNATLLAWGLVVLLCLPMLTSLPRVAMAGGPSLVLLSGAATPVLAQAHVPIWFAWGMASLVSVVLAARLFVFGVLPTVAVCWLITQIS